MDVPLHRVRLPARPAPPGAMLLGRSVAAIKEVAGAMIHRFMAYLEDRETQAHRLARRMIHRRHHRAHQLTWEPTR